MWGNLGRGAVRVRAELGAEFQRRRREDRCAAEGAEGCREGCPLPTGGFSILDLK